MTRLKSNGNCLSLSGQKKSMGQGAHLDRGEGGDDGGRAEAVRDEAEVGEVALDRGVEDLVRPRVAQRGPVLVEQIHQLLGDDPAREKGEV